MPIIRSALKKMRKDKVRTIRNAKRDENMKRLVRIARKDPSSKNLSEAFSALDKAAKVHLIHANRSARLKSALSRVASAAK